VGLERRGVSLDVRWALKQAYREIFQSDKTISEAVKKASLEPNQVPEVGHLIKFIQDSERGVTT
jgi:acyl-[acyl carrier protein]--UDP-N-acetylglucosamine O-acyltransferase